MTRQGKGVIALPPVLLDGVENGRLFLVHARGIPPWQPPQTTVGGCRNGRYGGTCQRRGRRPRRGRWWRTRALLRGGQRDASWE
jgi:hypothetical protein